MVDEDKSSITRNNYDRAFATEAPEEEVDVDDGDTTDNNILATVPTEQSQEQQREQNQHVSDDEFQLWFYIQLVEEASPLLVARYDQLMRRIAKCVVQWRIRYHGNKPLWKRIFKKDRVVKEIIESIPIISSIEQYVLTYDLSSWTSSCDSTTTDSCGDDDGSSNSGKITIVDLCSGKGYLSMVLSELLPPSKVEKFWLVDKQWPICHGILKQHHISWEHIYGDTNSTDPNTPDYYETWPIPLVTSKQDLKQNTMLRRFADRLNQVTPGPILVLAVHLCGTLSIQAIKLINEINKDIDSSTRKDAFSNSDDINCKSKKKRKKAQILMLKPCCLPGLVHLKITEEFQIGPNYRFPCKEVCAGGKWNNYQNSDGKSGRWKGPPRCHLIDRFHRWCHHLASGIESILQPSEGDGYNVVSPCSDNNAANHVKGTSPSGSRVELMEFPIQTKGGYQNSYIFASISADNDNSNEKKDSSASTQFWIDVCIPVRTASKQTNEEALNKER